MFISCLKEHSKAR